MKKIKSMEFVIKGEVRDPRAETLAFRAQKTMYGGRQIAEGDPVFVFASENEGGQGLVASGRRVPATLQRASVRWGRARRAL
jgi:hypothetical protein